MERFDAHFHIIDPAHPIQENNGFTPEPFVVADYRVATESDRLLGHRVAGGAVVSSSSSRSCGDCHGSASSTSVCTATGWPPCSTSSSAARWSRPPGSGAVEDVVEDVFWNNAAAWYLREAPSARR